MAKDTMLLITNDEKLIEKCEDKARVEHSIFIGEEHFDESELILLDYDTYIMEDEPMERIEKHADKIIFLGDVFTKGYQSVSKYNFDFDLLEYYFPENDEIQDKEEVIEDNEESLKLDYMVHNYMDLSKDMAEVEKMLLESPMAFRNRFYKLIPSIGGDQKLNTLSWRSPIKKQYAIYKLVRIIRAG